MSTDDLAQTSQSGIPFDEFWAWACSHPNCVLRAGTPNTALFDDEDFHWYLGTEEDDTCVIQVIRGKRLIGEVVVRASEIANVDAQPGEQEEWIFSLFDDQQHLLVQIVLSHGMEDAQTAGPITH